MGTLFDLIVHIFKRPSWRGLGWGGKDNPKFLTLDDEKTLTFVPNDNRKHSDQIPDMLE